jgi:hypothetical protein
VPAGPFLNAIKGTTGSAPGTGAFTPNAAASGFIAWGDSVWGVPTGWVGLVRYDDGTEWELRYGYWNGTTVSRPTNGFVTSSTGSALSLSSSATAAIPADGQIVAPHLGTGLARGYTGIPGESTSPAAFGIAGLTVSGIGGAATIATTNFLTEVPRSLATSASTANAQGGFTLPLTVSTNTTAGRGGWQFVTRFGSSQFDPLSRRLFVGVSGTTFVAVTTDPSAFTARYACFALDVADTNIQFLTNANTTTGTKIDTGLTFDTGGWYHAQIWMMPGGGRVYGLLIRLDTGAIWFGSTTTDIPDTTTLRGHVLGGRGAGTGTDFVMHMGAAMLRAGAF